MSEENIAIGLAFGEAISNADVDWILEHVAEDIEFIPQRAATEGRSFDGREGVLRFLEDNKESFDVFQVSIAETKSIEDRVVGVGTIRIRGKASGIETDIPTASVVTIRDGVVVSFRDHVEREKAFEAAGL